MVEDGIGASEVVCLWVVANEEKATIQHLVSKFKQVNPMCAKTITVMTDKDKTERNVIMSELPHIKLYICLFHTLHTFRREINVEKLDITAAQRNIALEIIQKNCIFEIRAGIQYPLQGIGQECTHKSHAVLQCQLA